MLHHHVDELNVTFALHHAENFDLARKRVLVLHVNLPDCLDGDLASCLEVGGTPHDAKARHSTQRSVAVKREESQRDIEGGWAWRTLSVQSTPRC